MTKSETSSSESAQNVLPNKSILIILGIIVVLLAVILGWLYTGSVNATKEKVFQTIPLPVAIVNARVISSTELYDRVNLAQDLLEGTNSGIDNLTDTILDQLINTKKIEVLAVRNNATPSTEDINNAYSGVLRQFPNQSEQNLETELKQTYGIDLVTFKNEVLRETVTNENLSLWHNRQESLNPQAYEQARKLLSQLDEGTDFDTVAQSNNDDPASNAFAGDSGFVPFNDLLPEFQDAVKDLAINDNKIVASRYGIQVLRINGIAESPDSSEDKNYNIQQIFIQPSDFNTWLDAELQKISSIKLL